MIAGHLVEINRNLAASAGGLANIYNLDRDTRVDRAMNLDTAAPCVLFSTHCTGALLRGEIPLAC
jgi:hypothetical protein